ncbi:MAG: sodium:solute symporter [Verrucomicrobia bacterium]|nr:sodium:solute symporter [Verrucomicrobiota bacterium]
MHPLDWTIVSIPLLLVLAISLHTRRYVKGISDYLAAGRVAGRYVVAVAAGEASMGLITVVAQFEFMYASGFAVNFWGALATPIMLLITLTGFAIYRYRESRAMTMGQFFEIRYSKKFRIFSSGLAAISGIVNYGLFPAVGARFLVYFCDLPQKIHFLGFSWPTFAVLMALFLTIAVVITCLGGQLTIMTSDCVMGILSYPMYLAVAVSIFAGFSWWNDIAPALLDRPPGKSMLNPFDVGQLRDFNLFFVLVGILGSVYSVLSWSGGQGFNAAAKNAHEQKMGKILGTWRGGFSGLMILLAAIAAYTFLHSPKFADRAAANTEHLAWSALEDTGMAYAPEGYPHSGRSPEALAAWKNRLAKESPATKQAFETIQNQMRVPSALRDILPVGVLGAFCAVMIFLMISVDSSYLHSWGSILIQDLVLPMKKNPFAPATQLLWLRLMVVLVAVYAFLFGILFGQVTYILMFFALTGSVYLGGAGAVILGGLYWKKGTTTGAWAAMLAGSGLAVTGFALTNFWTGSIYPILSTSPDMLGFITTCIEGFSAPFEPMIMWRVTPDKFFLNGQEVYLLTMLAAIASYVGGSLLTCRQNFNLDRMLHRGEYARADDAVAVVEKAAPSKWGILRFLKSLSGIDEHFTRGDKALSISVMVWSLGWGFGAFIVILAWNALSPWPAHYWANWFFIQQYIVGTLVAVVTTVWFTIGGSRDLWTMFQRLKTHRADSLDDGRVIGHANADDAAPEK